ncbi:aldehyde dehydrogenase family protein [Paramicrobacterium agarici]|uniref:Acyl-CoA reductase-like NAD-dependent aldehyde dehydrogenase n=1 Tax=Paramicrobacterium agarici TaxID=630514 RepID=A0A2A9DYN5_9MICO|nr:aldehyde dehydrogenase family protein [Microbacterium agarici]PFG31798.1 acyl-CoA reductase-like NAD-dependent aldehyde dehydrogenase [Microbacterium agarici]
MTETLARAPHAADDTRITICDPRSGELVGTLTPADADTIDDACERARSAFGSWSRTAPAARGEALAAAASVLEDHADELATLTQRETGKPFDDARGGVLAGVGTLRQYAELGPLHQGSRLAGDPSAVDYSIPEPRGVVAVITPWNDPVAIACGLIGAAVVTGNAVVHKPSERCPHVGERLGELLSPAFPPDVLRTLTGGGETGAALVSRPQVAMIAHVGSTATGERIARAAALTGAYVIRENGGNDPLIVDAGVDPTWAAQQAALGSFANSGQICTSVERIYVHDDVADAFVDALCAEAREWTSNGALGPLVDERMRDEVHRQLTESVNLGARVLVGGTIPEGPGSAYPATVVVDCTAVMPVFSEETFGPIASVQRVTSFDDAIAAASNDRYGLAATVLTPSLEHASRSAAELPVGTVKVNAVFGGAPGGSAEPRGASGSGFGFGPKLLDEMTRLKVVHMGTAEVAS